MIFFIYSRKSVYTGKGESIENQDDMCIEHIMTNYPDTKEKDIYIYEDEGFSGKNLERPKFLKMMADIKTIKPDFVVCYRLDRISRSVGDFAGLIEKLNRMNISFICIKEKFDTSTPMGKAMMYIASVFAQLERETIAERVRDNMILLAKLGRWLGGRAPTGFQSEKLVEVILDGKVKESCHLKIDEEELPIVQTIYDKFWELHSINGVRKFMAENQIFNSSGEVFSLIGIKQILQNPVYCMADIEARTYFVEQHSEVCFEEHECDNKRGLLSYSKRDYTKDGATRNPISKWIIAIGKHPGLISGQRWVSIQNILEGNKPVDGETTNTHNDYALLSGLIRCTKCGSRMFSKMRSGSPSGRFDYICNNKMHLGSRVCNCQNLNGEEADGLLCDFLLSYKLPTSSLHSQLGKLKRDLNVNEKPRGTHYIDKHIDSCNREISNLVSVLSQSGASPALIQRVDTRLNELEKELEKLSLEKMEMEMETTDEKQQEIQLELFGQALAVFCENFDEMSIQEKRTIIRLLISKCEWDGEILHIFRYGE